MQDESKIWRQLCYNAGVNTVNMRATLISHKTGPEKAHVVLRLNQSKGPTFAYKRFISPLSDAKFLGIIAGAQGAGDRLAAEAESRAPRLVGHDVGHRALLMDFADGKNLADLLRSGTDPPSLFLKAARWLGGFHLSEHGGMRSFWPQFLLKQTAQMAQTVQDGRHKVPYPQAFLQATSDLPDSVRSWRGQLTPFATRHGDPSVHNLIATPAIVWGIDIMPPAMMAVALDLGKLLVSLVETAGEDEGTVPALQYAHTRDVVLEGYTGPKPEPGLVDCMARHRAIMLWARMPHNPSMLTPAEANRLSHRMAIAKQRFK